jgi:hypothetical protein
MEDLDNRLAAIGYRPVPRERDYWRIAQTGVPARAGGHSASRGRDPAHSHVLQLWLDRLVDLERPTHYRIC